MANKKISSLNSLGGTPDSADIIPITDVSDTTGSVNGTTKKVTVANLVAAAPPVDGTQVTSTGETGATKFLREDGDGTCSFQNVDVDTPLNSALRGSDNSHIGAYPEQTFKITDNPYSTIAIVADEDGNLTYALKGASAEVRVVKGTSGTPLRFALSNELPAFILQNDTGEPDIEIEDPDGEKISIISGDSDTKGVNGLPIIQGYNSKTIGANPSPLLISGGTIS